MSEAMSWQGPSAGSGGKAKGGSGYSGGYGASVGSAGGKGYQPSPRSGSVGTSSSYGSGGARMPPGPSSAQRQGAAPAYASAAGGGAPTPTPTAARPMTGPGNAGTPPPVQVTGCNNQTVSNIIKGAYVPQGTNHGKPVYKKEGVPGSVSVLIYYWDERDGPSFSGWWFGPKVGGDQVWAYNPNKASPMPPTNSWKVPWDGPVDETLRLSMGTVGAAARTAPRQGGTPPSAAQPAFPSPRSHAREDEEYDHRRQEAERQRAQAEQQRREDERRRRDEESRRRQKEKMEEEARNRAEMRKRREEEEARKQEQQAALAVRKVIQRVRIATPETYDGLRAELEECQASNLEAMGSLAEKVSQEAELTLQQAQKRIDEINEKRADDERRRQEDEKRRKEEAEIVERLMKEASLEIKEAEDKVAEIQEKTKGLSQNAETTPDSMVEAAAATGKMVEAAKVVLENTLNSLYDKQKEMGDTDAAHRVKRDISDLHGRLSSGQRTLDKLDTMVKSTRQRSVRKAAALKKEDDRRAHFEKHDCDKDGKLSREEVLSFGKLVHDFQPSQEALDKIMRILEPVTFEKFHALHQKVAIAKSEVQARTRRTELEAKRKALAESRLAVQATIDEATESLRAAEEIIAQAETKAKPLTRDADLPADEIKALASAAEDLSNRADEELSQAETKLAKVEEDCAANDELQDFTYKDTPNLQQWRERAKSRTEKVLVAVRKARDQAVRKEYAEIDQKRTESVTAIRGFMTTEGKTGEQLFAHIAGEGDGLTREKFTTFLKELTDLKLADGQAERLYEHIGGSEDGISKERFLELIRLYYKCVKATVLSEDVSIKSKTVRRLDVSEVLEALEGPAKEEGAGVQRVRCQAVQDGATGWVTIAGNQGTAFLEPGGNFYSCVKETILTDGLSVQDSKTIRRITKGEVVEVIEFQKKDPSVDVKRIKGKAKLDGALGWITVCSNQGTTFLEPC